MGIGSLLEVGAKHQRTIQAFATLWKEIRGQGMETYQVLFTKGDWVLAKLGPFWLLSEGQGNGSSLYRAYVMDEAAVSVDVATVTKSPSIRIPPVRSATPQ